MFEGVIIYIGRGVAKMDQIPVSNTPLAEWLAKAMGQYRDPDTGMYGLSQNQLRKLSGVSQAAIWEILKQGHAPRAEVLIRLAEFFGESPFYLFRLAYLPNEKPERIDALEARIARLPKNLQDHVLNVALREVERLSEQIQVGRDC